MTAGFSLQARRFTDTEIFFAAVLGLTSVVLGNEGVVALAAGVPNAPSLLSQLCLPTTIAPFWVFFVLLPSALAFIAIGVPYALRTISAAAKGKLGRDAVIGLSLLAAACACGVFEFATGGSGHFSLAAITVVCLWQVRAPLAALPVRRATRLLGLAGACLAGLAYYENALRGGAEPSFAIAPTLYVAAFFFGILGLVVVTIGLTSDKGRLAAVCGWLAATAWILGSRAGTLLAGNTEPAIVEVAATCAAAASLIVIFLANEFRTD